MRRAWRIAAAVGCILGAGTVLSGVAGAAAGDPSMVPTVISEPVPGWTALPADQVSQEEQTLQGTLSKEGIEGGAKTALGEWASADQSGRLVVLVVVPTHGSLSNPGDFGRAFTSGACRGVGGTSTPVSAPSNLPNATEISCAASGQTLRVVGWASGSHAGAIAASTLSQSQIEALAAQQEAKLAAAFPSAASTSVAYKVGYVFGVLLVPVLT